MLVPLHGSGQYLDISGFILQKFLSRPNRRELYDGRIHIKYSVPQIYVSAQFDSLIKSCHELIRYFQGRSFSRSHTKDIDRQVYLHKSAYLLTPSNIGT